MSPKTEEIMDSSGPLTKEQARDLLDELREEYLSQRWRESRGFPPSESDKKWLGLLEARAINAMVSDSRQKAETEGGDAG